MITEDDVRDLRPCDVVELSATNWIDGTMVRGPLFQKSTGALAVGPTEDTSYVVRMPSGHPGPFASARTLKVISRVPRTLYVNHDRSEGAPGDLVCQQGYPEVTFYLADPFSATPWIMRGRTEGTFGWYRFKDLPLPLHLIVDGDTGLPVMPS